MNFLKSKTNLSFISIILLCVAIIIYLSATVTEKNKNIKNLNSEITINSSAIENAEKRIAEIESELSKTTSEIEETKSKYNATKKERDSLKKEKAKLEKENASLKKSVNKLSDNHQEKAELTDSKTTSDGKKICYLTFDDGPSDNTLKILKILDKYDAKATFFVINTSKINYVKKIHAAGHTVGLHSYTHDYSSIYTSPSAYFKDLKNISDTVKKLTGVESKIIRFPGGSSNAISKKYSNGLMPKLVKQTAEKGYFYFDWNVDSSDAAGNNVSYTKIRDSVLTAAVNKNSICVLMHDSYSKKSTVTALPGIIKGLKKQGYEFKALTTKSFGYHHNI